MCADKLLCKRFMRSLGVPTPDWQVWWPGEEMKWPGRPVMAKPVLGGSSVGMSLVRDEAALVPALEYAWACDPSHVLVEEYVVGLPVTVGVLQLPGGLLVFPPLATEAIGAEFYDAETKLDAESSGSVSVTAADLPAVVRADLVQHALALWNGLGCRGWARIEGLGLAGLSHADGVRAILHEALTRRPYDVSLPTPALGAATEVGETAD